MLSETSPISRRCFTSHTQAQKLALKRSPSCWAAFAPSPATVAAEREGRYRWILPNGASRDGNLKLAMFRLFPLQKQAGKGSSMRKKLACGAAIIVLGLPFAVVAQESPCDPKIEVHSNN